MAEKTYTPLASHWNGPFFQPCGCGEKVNREMIPTYNLGLNAMREEGSFLYTFSGRAIYTVAGRKISLEAGTALVYLQPNQGTIRLTPEGLPWHSLWIHVIGQPALGIFRFLLSKYGYIQRFAPDSNLIKVSRDLIRRTKLGKMESPFLWSKLTYHWLTTWWQLADATCTPLSKALPASIYSSKLLSFEPGTVTNLAAKLGYSRSYLSRKLSKQWSEPPSIAMRRARLEEAVRLLENTNLKISEISAKLGFSHASAFTRAFQRHYQKSPQAYRHSKA